MTIELKEISSADFELVRSGLLEIKNNPTPYDVSASKKAVVFAEQNFEGYLDFLNSLKSSEQPQGRVPSTLLWLFDEKNFVGIFDIRHFLNEHLRQTGGHIAYQIVPSYRGQGYALKGLELALKWCAQNLHLNEALLFCHAENYASDRVLQKALARFGGQRVPDKILDGHIERGVWLNTRF